jgi:pyruvate,water dikinase
MSSHIQFFRYETLDDEVRYRGSIGGKGANLLEMASEGFPVPEGFVVTTTAFREFLEERGLTDELAALAETDLTDQETRERFEREARYLITETSIPPAIRRDIADAYAELGDDVTVAVRSSGTAEDLADASFAGQLETYLNISGADAVVEHVKRCWASLFTERALLYRSEHDFEIVDTDIATIVQRMVDADVSGVFFTADPSTGADRMTIEASWGLGEAIVGGAVTPDRYIVGNGELVETVVNEKEIQYRKDPDTGETVEEPVAPEKRTEKVLSEDDVSRLVDIGEKISAHFDRPQDVEWAMVDDEIYLLQTRPITTITDDGDQSAGPEASNGRVLAEGLGVSAGTAEGQLCFTPIEAAKLDKQGQDVILVRERTSPGDMHGIKAAEGVLTTEGGTTSHAAIVAREMEKPAVVGCHDAEISDDESAVIFDGERFEAGDTVRLDGERGVVLTR